MTMLYFVRHAQPNLNNHDDRSRELTAQALNDCQFVIRYQKACHQKGTRDEVFLPHTVYLLISG